MPFANILFPVDFSERCHAVVPYVRAVSARFNAGLTLLHLLEVPSMAYGTPEAPAGFDFPTAEMKDLAARRLAAFAASSFPDSNVRTVLDEGDPGSCIAELARLWNIDLIMMPTRGLGRFRAALLGSVTAKTLHDATCAVWTDAHCQNPSSTSPGSTDDTALPAHTTWHSIVCAIDTLPEGSRLIRFAAELAGQHASSVRLVHSVPAADAGPERYMDLEFTTFLEERARQTISAMQHEAGTSFDVTVHAGSITEAIHQVAVTRRADLVLIGRGALPHFAGRLRSHAYAIVRDMPCPVLSI